MPEPKLEDQKKRAYRDVLASVLGSSIGVAATGAGLFPALGAGIGAGLLFAFLERDKLTKVDTGPKAGGIGGDAK
jgi:hypothetical protein